MPAAPSAPAPARSLTDRTLGALAWQFAGKAIEAVGRIAVTIVLARLLSPAAFGVAGAGLLVAALGATLTQLGVAPALVQRAVLTPAYVASGYTCSLILGVAGLAAVWSGADAVAAFFRMPELAAVTRAIAFCFPLSAPAMVAEALMMRDMRFAALARIDAVAFVLGYTALGIALALLGAGLWALVAAQLAQVALRSVLILATARVPLRLGADRAALGELLRFGSGHTLAELGNFVALQSDNLVVGRMLGASALGLYGRAYTLLAQPARLVGLVFDRVLFAAMAGVQDERERLARAQLRSLGGVALVMIPASALLVLLAPELVAVLLGAAWRGMVAPFQVLGATLLFRTSYKVSDSVSRARGATFRRAWRQWAYAAFVVAGAVAGSRWGLVGVATGVALAVFVNYLLMLGLSLSLTGGRMRDVAAIYARVARGTTPSLAAATGATLSLRAGAASDGAILLGGGAAGVAVFAVTFLSAPRLFGGEADWAHAVLMRRVARR